MYILVKEGVFILVVVLSRFQDIHVVTGNLVRNGLCCR